MVDGVLTRGRGKLCAVKEMQALVVCGAQTNYHGAITYVTGDDDIRL